MKNILILKYDCCRTQKYHCWHCSQNKNKNKNRLILLTLSIMVRFMNLNVRKDHLTVLLNYRFPGPSPRESDFNKFTKRQKYLNFSKNSQYFCRYSWSTWRDVLGGITLGHSMYLGLDAIFSRNLL